MLQLIKDNSYKIHNFTILGERHSGTNFLERLITKNFELNVTWHCGWKHFFGFNAPSMIRSPNTLFIGIIRNPYDWIMAMRKKPHHVNPDNLNSIESFLFNEWSSMQNMYKEIIEDRNLINNKRYKNIFELRKIKSEYLYFKAPLLCANYVFIRYEDLLYSAHSVLTTIGLKFNLKPIKNGKIKVTNKEPYIIDENIKTLIDDNINWDIENLLGYFKK
jgi:hypothetical protein